MSIFRKAPPEQKGSFDFDPNVFIPEQGSKQQTREKEFPQEQKEKEPKKQEIKQEQQRVKPDVFLKASQKAVRKDEHPTVVSVKDELTQKIESILEDDLTELFLHMQPEEQLIFKEKGEETAGKIRVCLTGAKVNIGKILGLLRDWLRLIPGVNIFFLEQEAKIKTERILKAAQKEKEML